MIHIIGLSGLFIPLIHCGPGMYLISNEREETAMFFLILSFKMQKITFHAFKGFYFMGYSDKLDFTECVLQ